MFHIQQIDLENYSIIVYSSSYDSLLSYLLDIEQKIKDDGDKLISETNLEVENLKKESMDDAEKRVKSLLSSEEENVNKILEIDEKKIDEVVNLLAERIVK